MLEKMVGINVLKFIDNEFFKKGSQATVYVWL